MNFLHDLAVNLTTFGALFAKAVEAEGRGDSALGNQVVGTFMEYITQIIVGYELGRSRGEQTKADLDADENIKALRKDSDAADDETSAAGLAYLETARRLAIARAERALSDAEMQEGIAVFLHSAALIERSSAAHDALRAAQDAFAARTKTPTKAPPVPDGGLTTEEVERLYEGREAETV